MPVFTESEEVMSIANEKKTNSEKVLPLIPAHANPCKVSERNKRPLSDNNMEIDLSLLTNVHACKSAKSIFISRNNNSYSSIPSGGIDT